MASENSTPRRPLWRAPLGALALLLMGAAQLPPDAAADSDEIVVEGRRLSPAEARERAISYVHATGIVAGKETVARWIDKVCPRVVGLSDEHKRIVETRFRAIAAEVGAPLASAGCQANVIINFVGDGAAFTRAVALGDRRRLGEISFEERVALTQGTAPIRWWYSDELRSRDGMRIFSSDLPTVNVDGVAGPALPSNGADKQTMQQYGSSHVSTQVNRALVRATVVVDTNRATGATLPAVAAYAAYVSLAEISAPEKPLDGSILGLFGAQPPRSLTLLDSTFLRELYSLPLDRKARQQRTRLVRALQTEQRSF